MKAYLFILILGFYSFLNFKDKNKIISKNKLLNSKTIEDTTIAWNEFYLLTWKDFLGKQDILSNYHAMTYIQIPFDNFKVYDDSIVFDLPCLFKRNQSWVIERTNSLLNHEQRHFDIGEVIARKMRKELSNYVCRSDSEATLFYKNVVDKYYFKENSKINQMYDTETSHGKNLTVQRNWDLKIKKMLLALEKFKDTHIVIPRKIKS